MQTVTLNISLPKKLADFVDREMAGGQYASRSEFFRTLLRIYTALVKREATALEFQEFKKIPLKTLKREMAATGKYNKKFIQEIAKGLAKSSIYADSTTPSRS